MVTGDRRLRILTRLADDQAAGLETRKLCEVCADVTSATGASIMLISPALPRATLCTSNDVSALIQQLQHDLGEGPCIDAHRLNRPVLEPDLADPETLRWVAFRGPVLDAGVRALFGFPVQVGEVRIGALNLYRDRPGVLDEEEHADALVMADVAAEAILMLQAGAPAGTVAPAIEASAGLQWVIHQAAGMVAAQMEVTVADAISHLRAYAFGNNRSLSDVARDVVARDVNFGVGTDEK